jgi:hypothetical protein
MILFFVMVLFLIESFVLIERGMSHIREWKGFEDFCVTHTIARALHEQDQAHVEFDKQDCCTRKCGYYFMCCPCFARCTHSESLEIRKDYMHKTEFLRYSALRTALIKSYNKHADELGNDDHRLTGDFDYAEYSIKVLADKLTEIVELSTGDWIRIWLVFAFYMAMDYIDLVTER